MSVLQFRPLFALTHVLVSIIVCNCPCSTARISFFLVIIGVVVRNSGCFVLSFLMCRSSAISTECFLFLQFSVVPSADTCALLLRALADRGMCLFCLCLCVVLVFSLRAVNSVADGRGSR